MHYEKGKCIHSKFDRYVFDYYKMYGLGFNVIGWENRSIRRTPQISHKSLINVFTYCCIEYTWPWWGFETKTCEETLILIQYWYFKVSICSLTAKFHHHQKWGYRSPIKWNKTQIKSKLIKKRSMSRKKDTYRNQTRILSNIYVRIDNYWYPCWIKGCQFMW